MRLRIKKRAKAGRTVLKIKKPGSRKRTRKLTLTKRSGCARPGPERPTSRLRSGSASASPARRCLRQATEWGARPGDAKRQESLEAERRRLSFVSLIVVDEVGHIAFDPEGANLMFSLVSARNERASMSLPRTSRSLHGEIFGDAVVAAAMVDRLVHHAEILLLKGDSYRLRDKDPGSPLPRD